MQVPSPAVAAVFEPVQTATTLEETVERLGTAIRLGLLAPGDRLPPERDLADQFGIARSTLRQALTSLTESGHLVATRGRGGFTGLLLGSTGLALVQHSDCPVMLVGPDAARAT